MLRAIICFIIAVALSGTFGQATDLRAALSTVVAACKLNYEVAGLSAPCLKVHQSSQPLEAYAILREPLGARRTIFTPLADVPGIEDSRLLTSNAPNYFALAWAERSIAIPHDRDQSHNVALAINASVNRTQDHLHIHMGCLAPDVASKLSASQISSHEFRRLNVKLKGTIYWARFFPSSDLSEINPIQLVERDVFLAKRFMGGVTIAVVRTEIQGQAGFVVLAYTMPPKPRQLAAAGDLVDQKCTD
jgi:CDP-diacylglycerol pyrophosphatase